MVLILILLLYHIKPSVTAVQTALVPLYTATAVRHTSSTQHVQVFDQVCVCVVYLYLYNMLTIIFTHM